MRLSSITVTPTSDSLRMSRPRALSQGDSSTGYQVFGERVSSLQLQQRRAGAHYRIAYRIERHLLHCQQPQSLTGDVDPLPERPQPQQACIDIGFHLIYESRGRVVPLGQQFDAERCEMAPGMIPHVLQTGPMRSSVPSLRRCWRRTGAVSQPLRTR